MSGLFGDVTAVWDQLSILSFASSHVANAAGLVGELSAQEFDDVTVTEAATAVDLMHASASATQEAGLSADGLLNVMDGSF